MNECAKCKHAKFDYCELYGTTEKQWFVCECKKDFDMDGNCEEFEEYREDE